jgi:hypothetical protein
MAIKLIANYSKRLGFPGDSSHPFSVSVEAELVTTDDIAGESPRLYDLLQASVDEQIQTTGFVPDRCRQSKRCSTAAHGRAPTSNASARRRPPQSPPDVRLARHDPPANTAATGRQRGGGR